MQQAIMNNLLLFLNAWSSKAEQKYWELRGKKSFSIFLNLSRLFFFSPRNSLTASKTQHLIYHISSGSITSHYFLLFSNNRVVSIGTKFVLLAFLAIPVDLLILPGASLREYTSPNFVTCYNVDYAACVMWTLLTKANFINCWLRPPVLPGTCSQKLVFYQELIVNCQIDIFIYIYKRNRPILRPS